MHYTKNDGKLRWNESTYQNSKVAKKLIDSGIKTEINYFESQPKKIVHFQVHKRLQVSESFRYLLGLIGNNSYCLTSRLCAVDIECRELLEHALKVYDTILALLVQC